MTKCRHPRNRVRVVSSRTGSGIGSGGTWGSVNQINTFRCEACGREWSRRDDYWLPEGRYLSELRRSSQLLAAPVLLLMLLLVVGAAVATWLAYVHH
jgi:hypothetical protein